MEVPTRRIERSTVTALLPVAALIPFWLLAMAIVWLPIRLVTGVPFWVVPTVWVLLGSLLFVPSIQVALLAPIFGARRPYDDELAILAPIWRDLSARANL